IVGTLKTAPPARMHFQKAGSTIVLLGGLGSASTHVDIEHFGGTQYVKVILDKLWGKPPALDMDYEKRVQATVRELVQEGALESAHDLSKGGLAVGLAESCFGPTETGADITLDSELPNELLLFHEGPSRVLVSAADPTRIF